MISNNIDDGNTNFIPSSKSFCEAQGVVNEDTKRIIEFIEFGFTYLNNKLDSDSKILEKKLDNLNEKKIDKKVTKVQDLKKKKNKNKKMDLVKAEWIEGDARITNSLNQVSQKTEEQSLKRVHQIKDILEQSNNEEWMNYGKYYEVLEWDVENFDKFQNQLREGFDYLQKSIKSLKDFMKSKFNRDFDEY